jgi:hypothetical protein
MIRGNENGTCMLINIAILGDRNVIKGEIETILKCKELTIEIQRVCNVKTKCNASNSGGNCNRLDVIQKIPELHTGKARNQGTTDNSHIGHCTRTAGSTDVKVQNI